MEHTTGLRDGEVPFAGRTPPADASLTFIGTIRSPWLTRSDCPKNLREAREWAAREGEAAPRVLIAARYRAALRSLTAPSSIWLVTWFDRARRDIAVQSPRHTDGPRGTFSLRSPVRPNPIGLHLVRLLDIDPGNGVLTVDAIDVLDKTPLLDIKPHVPSIDTAND